MFPQDNQPTESFPYRIENQVGTGSMGVVYRAREVALDRTVAIKVLRRSMLEEENTSVQDELRRRFLQEARAAASLAHPGITTVYSVGEADGLPYMVMEWLEGQTLESLLNKTPRLSVERSLELTRSLLATLEAAHRGGVVHRDIKPSNLVLLADGRLKVTDFGIALVQGRELVKTQAGVVLATPQFAAPEQLQGLEVDGRADLFATGVLLYRMLTGNYPFVGKSFMELANAVLTQDATPVRELVPEVPPVVDAAIRRALAKERQDRFPTAAAFAQALHPQGEDTAPFIAGASPLPHAAQDVTQILFPSHRDLPAEPALALAEIAASWPGKTMPRQETRPLLDRLLERPLHTEAFAGALLVGNTCLLLCGGMLLAAIDRGNGEEGDTVLERLPTESSLALHPLPPNLPGGLVSLMASGLGRSKVRHDNLDSTFVNLPALASKLQEERFNGLLRLLRGDSWAMIFFDEGQTVLTAFSEGWEGVPVEQSWQRWISEVAVRASIEEKEPIPLQYWYRRQLRNFNFQVRPVEEGSGRRDTDREDVNTSTRIRQMFQSSRTQPLGTARLTLSPDGTPPLPNALSYEQAPAYQLLDWMLGELPKFFAERDLTSSWKYLAEWIPLVREARLHHSLERPGSQQTDFFDCVTTDDSGKVLHLAHRLAHVTPERFEALLDRVLAAKKARTKTGDVGGVIFTAPHFGDDVLAAYAERIRSSSGSTFFGLEESLTGYAGFVRIGTRRGFHLLLVEEHEGFHPLLLGNS